MRGRRDHLLPQGYLKGFTYPDQRHLLSVYDLRSQKWFESRPGKVAAIRGFYDYSPGTAPDQTADQAFKEFEEQFPIVRRELLASGFRGWRSNMEFLLSYAQMLRVRSELFREQQLADARQSTMLRITEVFPDPATGNTSFRYEPLVEDADARATRFRNMAITNMRSEIAKGPALFAHFNWCIRLATDPTNPVPTSDMPIIVDGKVPTLEMALKAPNTYFFFPLCWQACLIGSPVGGNFDVEIDTFHPTLLKTVQSRYLNATCRFAYAPAQIDT